MYIVSLLISSTVIHNIFFSSSQLTLYNYITESIWYLIALLLIIFSHSTLFSEKIIKINNEANSITNKESKIKEINISDIVKKLINLRWFHGERIEENLNNLLNYKLEKIKKKSIICNFDMQIQIGTILFQLFELGLFTEIELKNIYKSNIITTFDKKSIKGDYSIHKFRLKNPFSKYDEINLKKYF